MVGGLDRAPEADHPRLQPGPGGERTSRACSRLRAAQPVQVTGIFDGATDKAVRNVQAFFRLTVDGVVGNRQTWPIIDMLASR